MRADAGRKIVGGLVLLSGLHCILVWLVFVPAAGKVWQTAAGMESRQRYDMLVERGGLREDPESVAEFDAGTGDAFGYIIQPLLARAGRTSMSLAGQVAVQGLILVALGLALICARDPEPKAAG